MANLTVTLSKEASEHVRAESSTKGLTNAETASALVVTGAKRLATVRKNQAATKKTTKKKVTAKTATKRIKKVATKAPAAKKRGRPRKQKIVETPAITTSEFEGLDEELSL